MAIFQFLHQPLYLSTSKTRQNLLQLFERSSNIVILPDMFQQQRLIGIFVQTRVSYRITLYLCPSTSALRIGSQYKLDIMPGISV